MEGKYIYHISGPRLPELHTVGGKAYALIELIRKGFRIPDGFVLSMEFFRPWSDQIVETPEWKAVVASTAEERPMLCERVKTIARTLPLGDGRTQALRDAIEYMKDRGGEPIFAVRSSDPDENLEGRFFERGYETRLWMSEVTVWDAIKAAFVSSLDAGVYKFKLDHGLDPTVPKIAAVVQFMIDAETSGIAWSLNITTGNTDQVVVRSSFHLAEREMFGDSTHDTFIISKETGEIQEKKIREQAVTIRLGIEGGDRKVVDGGNVGMTITDDQAMEIARLVGYVEEAYGKLMEIEWAFEDGVLHLLQARVIVPKP